MLSLAENEKKKHKQKQSPLVVYHLPTKSGNFGWIVNGKSNFVSSNGTFLGKTGFFAG